MLKKIFLLIISIIIFLTCFEIFLFYTDLDIISLKPTLFYNCSDPEAQRPSSNEELLYELEPNVIYEYEGGVHEKENKYKDRLVSTNSFGLRDYERETDEANNVFRIIVLGGSNTYGALVNNEDTYPAVLERKLNDKYKDSDTKFEVWNAGVHGYVMSQKVELAKILIQKYDPDLIIFQIHNSGRRGFPCGNDFTSFFKNNHDLYSENIPLLLTDNAYLNKIHYLFVDRFRFYRFILAKINYYIVKKEVGEEGIKLLGNFQNNERFIKYQEKGDENSFRKFDQFKKKFSDKKIIIFNPIPSRTDFYYMRNLSFIELECEKFLSEYCKIHPPSHVYEWYADEMLIELEKIDIIKNLILD